MLSREGEGDRKGRIQFKIAPQEKGGRYTWVSGEEISEWKGQEQSFLGGLTWCILGAAKGQCGCSRAEGRVGREERGQGQRGSVVQGLLGTTAMALAFSLGWESRRV